MQTVSNPGAGAPGPVTSTVYDSLNRPLFVCYPTADCEVTTYAGSVTTATDPAGKKRELTGDSLGRLAQVIEAPGVLGFTTNYSYDGLDNLTTVFQVNGGRSFNYDSLKRLLDATNPESGKIDYDYDENGNLLSVTQARKIPNSTTIRLATTNVYDELNRPMIRSYNDSTLAVNYCYDGKTYNSGACTTTAATFSYGQMTGVGNTNGSTNYTHNDQGRIQTSTPKVDIDRPFAYYYYADGTLAMSTIPGPKNRVTCYDLQGRPIWVSGQLTTADCINGTAATAANSYGWVSSFAPHGAVQELNFGATSTYKERWCYNARLQVSGIRLGAASTANCVYQGGDIFGLRLEYTASNQTANNGNLMQHFIQMRKSTADASEIRFRQDYGYDSINRITSANEFVEAGTGVGWQRGWNYDSVGNLAATSDNPLPAGTPALLAQYEQTTNRLKYFRSTLQAADVMNYDDSGNLTDRPANIGSSRTTYEYDAENRLRKVDGGATQENFYDGQGRRVKRVAGATTVTFIYNANGELVLEYGSPVSTPGVQFLTVDHLGSTRVAMRPDGSVVSRMDYEPFGVEAATTSRVADGYTGDPTLRQRFTGKERDAESGLDYFGARFLSAAMGRFTGADPSSSGITVGDPQSWNLYSYTRNRPLSNVDVNGNWSQPVHHDMVRYALSGLLSAGDVEFLVQRQVSMDKDQSAGGSFMHAMGQPGMSDATTLSRMWGFVADNVGSAGADASKNGVLTRAGLAQLGDAIHTLQDSTSPQHMTEGGSPIVWRGLGVELRSGAALGHSIGEDFASDSWSRFGQAVRLTLAAFLQASPEQARRAGLSADSINKIADQRISQYVNHFYGTVMPSRNGRSEAEIESSRQCALGNPAACR